MKEWFSIEYHDGAGKVQMQAGEVKPGWRLLMPVAVVRRGDWFWDMSSGKFRSIQSMERPMWFGRPAGAFWGPVIRRYSPKAVGSFYESILHPMSGRAVSVHWNIENDGMLDVEISLSAPFDGKGSALEQFYRQLRVFAEKSEKRRDK